MKHPSYDEAILKNQECCMLDRKSLYLPDNDNNVNSKYTKYIMKIHYFIITPSNVDCFNVGKQENFIPQKHRNNHAILTVCNDQQPATLLLSFCLTHLLSKLKMSLQ